MPAPKIQLPEGRSGSWISVTVLAAPPPANFEAMEIALRAGLLESQRVDKEALGFADFAHG